MDQVEVYAEGDLSYLLCGRMPRVATSLSKTSKSRNQTSKMIDMTGFPPEQEYIRPKTNLSARSKKQGLTIDSPQKEPFRTAMINSGRGSSLYGTQSCFDVYERALASSQSNRSTLSSTGAETYNQSGKLSARRVLKDSSTRSIPTIGSPSSNRPQTAEPQKTKKYNKIKKVEGFLDEATEYLGVYEDNHKRKAMQIHQDWEELYMNPFHERMRKKLNGNQYKDFRQTRSRAATATGDRPVLGTLSSDIPVDSKSIKIPVKGLTDRVHKHTQNAKKEKALSEFILKTTGNYVAPTELKERDTLDTKAWRTLPETRFYTQNPEEVRPKGKQIFEKKYTSTLPLEMSQF